MIYIIYEYIHRYIIYIYNIYIYIFTYIYNIYIYIYILYTQSYYVKQDGNQYTTVTKCTYLLEIKETILKDPIKSY